MDPFTFRRTPLGLRYSDPTDGSQGGGTAKGQGDLSQNSQDAGYPANTPVADMTSEQQIAYWKYHSRKHESAATSASRERDELKTKAARLDELENAQKTDEQKQHEQALEDARRNGENIGAERYLRPAVIGEFRAATGKSRDDVETILKYVDIAKFVKDNGDIDSDAIDEYVTSAGLSAPNEPRPDPVGDAFRRGGDRNRHSGGSIAATRDAYVAAHSTKN